MKTTRLPGLFAALTLLALTAGCATSSNNGITQVATIDALLAGGYDGYLSLADLRRYGDFGIGTFEGLDGEMILLDGRFHQARADGRVVAPADTVRTPFACVTRFVPDRREALAGPLDLAGLEKKIDARVPSTNRFVAFRVRGQFHQVKVRSVPPQKKPYPPLAEVTKSQPVFNHVNVRGTLVGFRSPPFVKGVNVPGYHVHFLADDNSGGGHVLEFELAAGTLEVDTVQEWMHVILPPPGTAFDGADLARDRAAELQAVEKNPRPAAGRPK